MKRMTEWTTLQVGDYLEYKQGVSNPMRTIIDSDGTLYYPFYNDRRNKRVLYFSATTDLSISIIAYSVEDKEFADL